MLELRGRRVSYSVIRYGHPRLPGYQLPDELPIQELTSIPARALAYDNVIEVTWFEKQIDAIGLVLPNRPPLVLEEPIEAVIDFRKLKPTCDKFYIARSQIISRVDNKTRSKCNVLERDITHRYRLYTIGKIPIDQYNKFHKEIFTKMDSYMAVAVEPYIIEMAALRTRYEDLIDGLIIQTVNIPELRSLPSNISYWTEFYRPQMRHGMHVRE